MIELEKRLQEADASTSYIHLSSTSYNRSQTRNNNTIRSTPSTTISNKSIIKMNAPRAQPRHLSSSSLFFLIAAASLALLLHHSHLLAQAASSARISGHHVEAHANQYFLTEFCDLESRTLRAVKPFKQDSDSRSLIMNTKSTASSVRIKPQKQQQLPSSISFGPAAHQATPVYKQLNCTINVQAPASHGLLVTINSIGLPKNLTRLSIVLNKDSPHATQMNLEGETTSANYLLTEPQSSKIAINLQSFQPIDWSHVSFDILFSVYKKGNSTGCPNKKWFDCGDDICVPSHLVCDSNKNCPNGRDELVFLHCYSPLFLSIAASLALILILIIASISVILISRHKRLNKHHSFSNSVLAAEVDFISTYNSSKLDLTQPEVGTKYLANIGYIGGFENPAWCNSLTKQDKQQVQKYAQVLVASTSSYTPTPQQLTSNNLEDPETTQTLVSHR